MSTNPKSTPIYFLTHPLFGTKEVTKEQFIAEERNQGFYPKSGRPDDCATGGFGTLHGINGSIRYIAPGEVSQGDGYVLAGYRYSLPESADEAGAELQERFAWLSVEEYEEKLRTLTAAELKKIEALYLKKS